MPKITKTGNIEFEQSITLIEFFCRNPKGVNWPQEVKMAKKMLKLHDIHFWLSLECGKFNSLSFFFCADGLKYVNDVVKERSVDIPESKRYSVEEDKTYLDSPKSDIKKGDSVLDFLR